MGRPILFLVNDQERDLRELAVALDRRFGADYHILSEHSRDEALIALDRLAAASERVALLIGAPRIAGSDGVEFLVRAHQLHPGAKRVLLIGRGRVGCGLGASGRAGDAPWANRLLFVRSCG